MMRKVVHRYVVLALPLSLAMWIGCSDRTGGDEPGAADAAAEAAMRVPTADAFVAADAADASPPARDCAADLQADGLPMHLDCTGLYADPAAKTVAAANQAYTPAVPFWSDGADKSRWILLPTGTTIDITNFDEWIFPDGTKIWKEFRVAGKRIETRLYQKATGSWRHTTFRWDAGETEAVREVGGEKIALTGPGQAPYEVPNTSECNDCHSGRKEPVLGFEAVQLALPGAQGLTLAALAAQKRFNLTPPRTTITLPDDASGTGKAAPALAWLHANCGQCHNRSDNAGAAFTGLFFLLRPSQLFPDGGAAAAQDLDAWTTAVNVAASRSDDAGVPYLRIKGGDPASSLASILSGRRVAPTDDPTADYQMPPLVTRKVDVAGHALLDAWITVIPP